jgi:L-idonate 5-dehydrogenase
MKAVVVHAAGDLRVDELPKPEPGPGEVLLAVEWGGICGSDLAYLNHGASGIAILKHPMILGHEFAGHVAAVGAGVDVPLGLRAAVYPATPVDPSNPQHLPKNLEAVRYYGSAALDPHTDGGFAEYKVVQAGQLRPLPDNVDTRHGALAEPLAVALHAVHRAATAVPGGVKGQTILINGSGPIGVLVLAAARALGAGRTIVADVAEPSLRVAQAMGADELVDVKTNPLPQDISLVFEASGAAGALGGVLHAAAKGGTVVQVGNLSANPVTAVLGDLVGRELTWLGSFRFADEMTEAIALMAQGLDLTPVMTHQFGLDQAAAAFAVAADRSTGSSKVMLALAPSAL